jgi:ParB-like chromosome segregation protein Spo0J
VIENLIVRSVDAGADFEIIAGERRWRAAMLVKL